MMMMLPTLCCLLIMAAAAQAATIGRKSDGSEVELRTMVYRLSTDVGTILQDMKTMLWFVKSMTSTDKQETSQKEEDMIPSCAGVEEGLTSLQVGSQPLTAACDGDGWIVFLRRVDDQHNFPKRNWSDYKEGFGNLRGSFWFGLDKLHLLTNPKPAKMRVELEAWDGETRYAQYSSFRIESEQYKYRLHIDGYTGNAGDSLHYHNGMKFSAPDQDNDDNTGHCAEYHNGGWWFNSCFHSLLTSEYVEDGVNVKLYHGMQWKFWKGNTYSYKKVQMKLRLD